MGSSQSYLDEVNDEINGALTATDTNKVLNKYAKINKVASIMYSIEPRYKHFLNNVNDNYIESYLLRDIRELDKRVSNYTIISTIKKIKIDVTKLATLLSDNYTDICKNINSIIEILENYPDYNDEFIELNLSEMTISFLKKKKDNIKDSFDNFYLEHGLKNLNIVPHNNDVGKIFTYSIDTIIDKLTDNVSIYSKHRFISFPTVFEYIEFHLIILENIINKRINERIEFHMKTRFGWNAFYTCIWYKFRNNTIGKMRKKIADYKKLCKKACDLQKDLDEDIEGIINTRKCSKEMYDKLHLYCDKDSEYHLTNSMPKYLFI